MGLNFKTKTMDLKPGLSSAKRAAFLVNRHCQLTVLKDRYSRMGLMCAKYKGHGLNLLGLTINCKENCSSYKLLI